MMWKFIVRIDSMKVYATSIPADALADPRFEHRFRNNTWYEVDSVNIYFGWYVINNFVVKTTWFITETEYHTRQFNNKIKDILTNENDS